MWPLSSSIYRMECWLVLLAAGNWQCSRWCRIRCCVNWWTLCRQKWTSTTPVAAATHRHTHRQTHDLDMWSSFPTEWITSEIPVYCYSTALVPSSSAVLSMACGRRQVVYCYITYSVLATDGSSMLAAPPGDVGPLSSLHVSDWLGW